MHNYCIPHFIKENFENFLIHRCKYIPLSQVYCLWQVVKTPTIIFSSPVLTGILQNKSLCGHWKMWWKNINLSSTTTNISIRSVIHALQTLAINWNFYVQKPWFYSAHHFLVWGGGGGWRMVGVESELILTPALTILVSNRHLLRYKPVEIKCQARCDCSVDRRKHRPGRE
jgi:hypothetical protein